MGFVFCSVRYLDNRYYTTSISIPVFDNRCYRIFALNFFFFFFSLQLFEILEFDDGYELVASVYDALVKACISLKSIRGVKMVYNYIISNGFELDQYTENRLQIMHVKCGMVIGSICFSSILEWCFGFLLCGV